MTQAAFGTPVTPGSTVPLATVPPGPELASLRAVDRLVQSPPAELVVPALGVRTDQIADLGRPRRGRRAGGAGFPPGPELRLITLGGVSDRGTGPHAGNAVALERLVGSAEGGLR